MSVTINASTSTGLVQTADTSGNIELQNNGTTRLTVNSSGVTIPTLTATTISDGTNSTSATNCIQGSARAWVNFNGTGTVAIRASYNVSSITDNGLGNYNVNFTNAFSDTNYAVTTGCQAVGSNLFTAFVDNFTVGSFRIVTVDTNNDTTDTPIVCVSVFR